MNMSFVKNIIYLVVQPFTYICDLSFATGIFPDVMKIAKVIPILETGAKVEFNNNRPILLLPRFSKILAKLFDDRFYAFICNSLDNTKTVIGVFIDLKKAFDTIDHTVLLQNLNHYGIHGIVNQWVCSYIAHRKQYVQIKVTKSNLESILCGVPQG